MTLQDLGAIGELIGSLGVVASLLYLAVQVRQNTKAERTRAVYSYMQSYGDAIRAVAASKESSRVFRVGSTNPSQLDPDETHQFFYLVGQFMTNWEGLFSLYEAGTLGERRWGAVRADISTMLATPGGRAYWAEARPAFSSYPSLVASIDCILVESGPTWNPSMPEVSAPVE